MASFDGQNRTCGGEEDGVGKKVGSSEVGGDADIFYDASDGGHRLYVGQDGRKVKFTTPDGFTPKGLDGLLRKSKPFALEPSSKIWLIIETRTSSAIEWVASSLWMLTNCSMASCALGNPAAVKSLSLNFESASE